MGHIVCKEGVCVDPTKVIVILNIPPLMSVKQLTSTLGHTGYYCRFIHKYASITAPLEKLLMKYEKFAWSDECEFYFNVLKENFESALILVYPDWNKQFHVHIDTSSIALGVVLAQSSDGNIDNLIYFARKKIIHGGKELYYN